MLECHGERARLYVRSHCPVFIIQTRDVINVLVFFACSSPLNYFDPTDFFSSFFMLVLLPWFVVVFALYTVLQNQPTVPVHRSLDSF